MYSCWSIYATENDQTLKVFKVYMPKKLFLNVLCFYRLIIGSAHLKFYITWFVANGAG